MLVWSFKDPDEVVDYSVDWRGRLGSDTISAATFTVSSGTVVIDSTEFDDRYSVARISGGALGEKARILCEIDTEDGQTMQETASLVVRAR